MTYEIYYLNQCGRGGDYFRGTRYQKGHGLGNILGGLVRASILMLKRTAISVGKELLHTGMHQGGKLVQDIISGKPVKQSLKRRAIEGGSQLVNKRLKKHTKKKINKSRNKIKKKKRSKDIFA